MHLYTMGMHPSPRSLAVIRLGMYAPRFNSVDLTAVKKMSLAVISIIWFGSLQV